ncbi:hypothetical protein OIU84_018396 [Salix udensis]|uniref:Uncharacterized protein n=1 Tax=Salix udensis TaxID=889485 RepID=A0AAD6KW96_9ROSI|nr:hypothetical protein OIU84_018396 [Salix udensis]
MMIRKSQKFYLKEKKRLPRVLAEAEYHTGLNITQVEKIMHARKLSDSSPGIGLIWGTKGTFGAGGRLFARPKCSSMAAKPSSPILARRSA